MQGICLLSPPKFAGRTTGQSLRLSGGFNWLCICFPLFFFVRFISGILFLKEAIVGCYSIYKGCIFCEVLFGPRIVTCTKNCFDISTIVFSLKREKRRILGENFSQNPPLNGGVGGSGPLNSEKYLFIFTQKMGTKKPRNRCGFWAFRCNELLKNVEKSTKTWCNLI